MPVTEVKSAITTYKKAQSDSEDDFAVLDLLFVINDRIRLPLARIKAIQSPGKLRIQRMMYSPHYDLLIIGTCIK